MTIRKRPPTYEFEIALSFAGEERHIAEGLANLMVAEGIPTFYDKHNKARLWGKDERELEQIYGPASRFVVPIISKHYVKKTWPLFEFETALREERNRSTESILPIRADNSRLPGLHDGRFYLSLAENDLGEIAACLIEKCKEASRGALPNSRSKTPTVVARKFAALDPEYRLILGIIVASRLRLPLGLYKSLFPSFDWASSVRSLIQVGLVQQTGESLKASAQGIKAVQSESNGNKASTDQWVKRLEELKDHQDIAIYLAVHYTSEQRLDDAVCVLADVGNQGLHGHWNDSIFEFLSRFTNARVTRRISSNTRIRLFHALAICATRADRFEDALAWFEKARKESINSKEMYWIGQCHINSGVALSLAGDRRKAAAAYQRAIAHGEEENDPLLAGRALGNLAQLRMEEGDYDAAISLMKKSIALKKMAKDELGTATSPAQLGAIEAKRGNLTRALKHFAEAEVLFAEKGFIHDQAKSAYNIGRAYCDLGQHGKGLQAYKRALRLVLKEADFIDLRLLIIQSIAQAYHVQNRFHEIEQLFETLLESPISLKHVGCVFSAHLGIGLSQCFQGRTQEGRDHLKKALKLARKSDRAEWTVQVLSALASIAPDGSMKEPSPGQLARMAKREEKKKAWSVAADIWEKTAKLYVQHGKVDNAESAYASCGRCLSEVDRDGHELVSLQFTLFTWRWQTGRYEDAMAAIFQAQKTADLHGLHGERVKAIDLNGVGLQLLNRSKEAVDLHKQAVSLAERFELPMQRRISLNNLGEAYRAIGALKQAVAAFEASEELCRTVGEFDDALGTMVNRGLVVEELGDQRAARAIFNKCRAESKRRRCWEQYVRASEALGNLAWRQSQLKAALKHYAEATSVAKKEDLEVEEAEVAVNHAALLSKTGKARQGLTLLKPHEPRFARMRQGYVAHSVLADLLFENGDVKSAKEHWEKGKTIAFRFGDTDHVVNCAARLGDLYEKNGCLEQAEEEIKTAIVHEDELEGKAILLSQLLRIQLAQEKETETQRTFDEARTLAKKVGAFDTLIDIHVYVADHEWTRDLDAKGRALRFYLTAIMQALYEPSFSSLANLFSHVILQMTAPKHAPTETDFDKLLDDLRSELTTVTIRNTHISFVLWPFESARRLLPLRANQKAFETELRSLAMPTPSRRGTVSAHS